MRRFVHIPIIFCALAVFFLVTALVSAHRHGPDRAEVRRIWFRIGLIFAAICIFLIFVEGRFP